jgi:hypothetical protein
MSSIDDLLKAALDAMPAKPDESATQAQRKRYSEELSAKLSLAFATHLRGRGLEDARPAPPGVLGGSGAERRMSGGIGAKKVDVTWATAESGLILAISIKTINSRDRRTKNFQKNLVNRRGDMLMEAVTLHRRFPYAVLCGLMFLDVAAASDGRLDVNPRLQMLTCDYVCLLAEMIQRIEMNSLNCYTCRSLMLSIPLDRFDFLQWESPTLRLTRARSLTTCLI